MGKWGKAEDGKTGGRINDVTGTIRTSVDGAYVGLKRRGKSLKKLVANLVRVDTPC